MLGFFITRTTLNLGMIALLYLSILGFVRRSFVYLMRLNVLSLLSILLKRFMTASTMGNIAGIGMCLVCRNYVFFFFFLHLLFYDLFAVFQADTSELILFSATLFILYLVINHFLFYFRFPLYYLLWCIHQISHLEFIFDHRGIILEV